MDQAIIETCSPARKPFCPAQAHLSTGLRPPNFLLVLRQAPASTRAHIPDRGIPGYPLGVVPSRPRSYLHAWSLLHDVTCST
jgi:hypothetical protein